jgi:hypothetical protein
VSAGTWWYRHGSPRIIIKKPWHFLKHMRNALIIMVMHWLDSKAGAIDLLEWYLQWQRVFSEGEVATLPDNKMTHAILLEPGKSLPYGLLYSLSQYKLKVLREYLDKMLARGWIY